MPEKKVWENETGGRRIHGTGPPDRRAARGIVFEVRNQATAAGMPVISSTPRSFKPVSARP